MSEIEPFPRSVLAHHYPEVPLHGDFTTIKAGQYRPIDVLVGGTPCQSFSVAGLRGGLDDSRGNLALEYLRLADRLRPKWLVWENVPGVLSSNGGRDFGSILGGMVELGYGVAYRVLDAQFFGVAQRRRRVFVVGYLGDWRRAAAVLFERNSLSGNPPPRRKTGQGTTHDVAPSLTSSGRGERGPGETRGQDPVIAVEPGPNDHPAHTLRGEGFDASEDGSGRGTPLAVYVPPIVPPAMSSKWSKGTSGPAGDEIANIVAFAIRGREGGAMPEMGGDVSNALRTPGGGGSVPMIAGAGVRRLTPTECERLQGFPDGYTAVIHRKKPAADGPRYKALGNSMAVPVMAWIGRRIAAVEAIEDPA